MIEGPTILTLEVGEDAESERLDKFLAGELEETLSRERIKRLILEGCVAVEAGVQTKPSFRLKEGSRLTVTIPELQPLHLAPEPIALDVVFEDDDLLVVNKPAGMLTHPTFRRLSGTLVNAVLHHCEGRLSGINGVLRPGIVHRLDRDTSGLLMVAKSDRAHRSLSEQLQQRTAKREYWAVVQGDVELENGKVVAALARHPKHRELMRVVSDEAEGRYAETHWEVVERLQGRFTHIQLRLETGRTHQIRVHMAHLGHPVLGDRDYGQGVEHSPHIPSPLRSVLKKHGQLLQAFRLRFTHPVCGEAMAFELPMETDMALAIKLLRGEGPVFDG